MENIEQKKDIISKQENTSDTTTDRLHFLNDEKLKDIKEPLTKTITNLSNEHIIAPEEDFRNNIEQVTKDIFSDPLYDFDIDQKTTDAQNIFLFRTKFEKRKKEKEKKTKEEKANKKKENKDNLLIEKSENYKGLMKMYEETESTYKIQDENLTNYKNAYLEGLSEESKNNFQTLLPDEQENYLKARYSAEKITEEARKNNTISEKHVAFIEQFNKLDQELNLNSQIDVSDIPREGGNTKKSLSTMSDIINKQDIGETLVEENQSINTYINDANEIATEDKKDTLFPIEKIKNKILQRYPKEIEKALDSLLQKNNLTQYKENFNKDGTIKNTEKIPTTDKKKLEKISTKIDEATTILAQQEQTKMFEETNKVIKTKVIETLIKNIGQYFEVTSFQRGNMAEQFSIDTKNGIKFDKDMISLSGKMDGKQIGFYYDINNGEIRSDDFIHLDKETYYINDQKEKTGREKLPIKMDTMSQIMDTTKKTAQANIQKSIETSKTQQEYSKELASKTSVKYKQESPVAKTIIEHTMEKNIAIQETHDFIQKYLPTKEAYNKQGEEKEYQIYNMIDTTFNRYTVDEIKQRKGLLQRFQRKINEKTPNFEDKMISNLFDKPTARTQQKGIYDKEKGPNIYQFMQGLTYESGSTIKQNVINLTLFDQVVNQLEKESGTTKNIQTSKKYQKLWNNFEEQKSQENLDNELDQQLATI